MLAGIFAGQSVPAIVCAYPLNDDGTLSAVYGYGYAGPAIGGGQQMQYTTIGDASAKLLLASGAFSSARFSRGASPIGFEASVTDKGGANGSGLGIILTNAAGILVNAGSATSSADGDLIQIEVAADGTITAQINGAPYSIPWLYPAGQATVSATDKFAPFLWLNDSVASEVVDITLITDAASMTGTYTAGTVDICGTTI